MIEILYSMRNYPDERKKAITLTVVINMRQVFTDVELQMNNFPKTSLELAQELLPMLVKNANYAAWLMSNGSVLFKEIPVEYKSKQETGSNQEPPNPSQDAGGGERETWRDTPEIK